MGAKKTIVLLAVNSESAEAILKKYSKLRKLSPTVLTEYDKVPKNLEGKVDLLFYEKGTDPEYILALNQRNLIASKMVDPSKKNFTVVTGKVKRFLSS